MHKYAQVIFTPTIEKKSILTGTTTDILFILDQAKRFTDSPLC